MADNDEEYLPEEEKSPGYKIRYRKRMEAAALEEKAKNMETNTGGEITNTKRTQIRLPTDNATLKRMLKDLETKGKGQDITLEVSLRVLKASLTLQLKYLQEK